MQVESGGRELGPRIHVNVVNERSERITTRTEEEDGSWRREEPTVSPLRKMEGVKESKLLKLSKLDFWSHEFAL